MMDQCSRGWHEFRTNAKFCPRCGVYLEELEGYTVTLRVPAIKLNNSTTPANSITATPITPPPIAPPTRWSGKDNVIIVVTLLVLCILAVLIYLLPEIDKPIVSFFMAGCGIACIVYRVNTMRRKHT